MQGKINGENPFKVLKDTFSVGPTTNGYTLNYAVKSEGPWTAYTEETPANETLIVNGCTPYMWFMLSGNTDNDVDLIV